VGKGEIEAELTGRPRRRWEDGIKTNHRQVVRI
jgi:hypothetical protein